MRVLPRDTTRATSGGEVAVFSAFIHSDVDNLGCGTDICPLPRTAATCLVAEALESGPDRRDAERIIDMADDATPGERSRQSDRSAVGAGPVEQDVVRDVDIRETEEAALTALPQCRN